MSNSDNEDQVFYRPPRREVDWLYLTPLAAAPLLPVRSIQFLPVMSLLTLLLFLVNKDIVEETP